MKYNFCTLFDSYYLTRGIALYRSLEKHCRDFHLYIFSFDDKSFSVLTEMKLAHATIISLKDFENEELLRVKPTRTIAEYCWTCTASTIWYAIRNFNLDHCTYLDADMLFFASPDPIFEEIGGRSSAITKHNFSPNLKSQEVYGKYCVQFVFFRNDEHGMKALAWWRESCIEWCYANLEETRYGDQKYLDYFEEKFDNVCVVQHIGVGVAPWNYTNYHLRELNGQLRLSANENMTENVPLIFYHYQGLKFTDNGKEIISEPAFLKIGKNWLAQVYTPYIRQLTGIQHMLTGTEAVEKKIVFQRTKIKSVIMFFRLNVKRFSFLRTIFYALKKNRYDRPKGIGGNIS
ncbi:hypothetical protein ACFOTA_13690 [Chitinophaga sp. GCM10012297]|uniref:Glycosyl transferase n=1 Tax=Chitinophaga chungangae TaxID=2821488 RepID=A0ABS3YF18_9BACT|nr:hypothetical protein [Chitinophaga chungangae]MBO9153268.1 hypothetical protein [Chitinophaga chungangae]